MVVVVFVVVVEWWLWWIPIQTACGGTVRMNRLDAPN